MNAVMNIGKIWVILLSGMLLMSCGNRAKSQPASQKHLSNNRSAYELHMPQIPPVIKGEAAKEYFRDHIWDGFDFSDTLQLPTLDHDMMMRAFAYYVSAVPNDKAQIPMHQIMHRASGSKAMLDYFADLAQRVLNDPNSQERSDEKYIPVLEFLLQSPLLDEYEKMPYISDLYIASQNRVGHHANDFVYTTADGREATLMSLKAEYTIIFISNPGCPMCRQIKQQIIDSDLLNMLIVADKLKILVLYPDEDLEAWREHIVDYPSTWINAYDKGCSITLQRTYDLRAIPALYLLDVDKVVMAKDCTDVGYIEKLILESGHI